MLDLALPYWPVILGNIGLRYGPLAVGDCAYMFLRTCIDILGPGLQTGLAVYLLAGAPGLVRWHVKKIGEASEAKLRP